MKTIIINSSWSEVPGNFTGIVKCLNGNIFWCKNGLLHREGGPASKYTDGHEEWQIEGYLHRLDGPAVKYKNGHKGWYLESYGYDPINLNNHIVLDYYQGKFGIMWYKLLDKDKIFEYPDILGLITK